MNVVTRALCDVNVSTGTWVSAYCMYVRAPRYIKPYLIHSIPDVLWTVQHLTVSTRSIYRQMVCLNPSTSTSVDVFHKMVRSFGVIELAYHSFWILYQNNTELRGLRLTNQFPFSPFKMDHYTSWGIGAWGKFNNIISYHKFLECLF